MTISKNLSVLLASLALSVGFAATAYAAGDKWALLIGVDKCKAVGELEVCSADAVAMKAVLENIGYPATHISMLVDNQTDFNAFPTLSNVERAITRLADVAEAGDTVLFFFSGHGVTHNGNSMLVPTDGDLTKGVSLTWIKDQFAACKAKEKVMILDACHSGAAKGVSGITPDLKTSGNLIMFLSCEKDQVSWPDAEGRHSVFTKAVLDGLSGKAANADKKVTHLGLATYVRKSVKDWTYANQKNKQTPVLVADAAGDIVLADVALMTLSPSLTAAREPKPGDTKTVDLGSGVKLELVWCPAGSFMMGNPESEVGRSTTRETQHRVTLTQGFWIGKTEVTQRQWERVMGSNPSNFKGADLPVEQVSWNDCQTFLKKLGAGARLPTEAEWEYACRAGSTTALNSGKALTPANGRCQNLDEVAWYRENSDSKTHLGAQKQANAWGLYDMHGNVWEWCSDWYGDCPLGSVTDPQGAQKGMDRVVRGGSWNERAPYCRSADRDAGVPFSINSVIGFRAVLSPGQL